MQRTIFTMEPAKNERSHRGGLYEFKIPGDELMVYCCNGDEAEVKKLQNQILDAVEGLPNKEACIKIIEEYGDARVDEARGDWYESICGESL